MLINLAFIVMLANTVLAGSSSKTVEVKHAESKKRTLEVVRSRDKGVLVSTAEDRPLKPIVVVKKRRERVPTEKDMKIIEATARMWSQKIPLDSNDDIINIKQEKGMRIYLENLYREGSIDSETIENARTWFEAVKRSGTYGRKKLSKLIEEDSSKMSVKIEMARYLIAFLAIWKPHRHESIIEDYKNAAGHHKEGFKSLVAKMQELLSDTICSKCTANKEASAPWKCLHKGVIKDAARADYASKLEQLARHWDRSEPTCSSWLGLFIGAILYPCTKINLNHGDQLELNMWFIDFCINHDESRKCLERGRPMESIEVVTKAYDYYERHMSLWSGFFDDEEIMRDSFSTAKNYIHAFFEIGELELAASKGHQTSMPYNDLAYSLVKYMQKSDSKRRDFTREQTAVQTPEELFQMEDLQINPKTKPLTKQSLKQVNQKLSKGKGRA